MDVKGRNCKTIMGFGLLFLLWLFASTANAEPVCAEVKIQIQQELTLERQAFDANMKITNDLDTLSLDNVTIKVNFKDEDGNLVNWTSDPNNTTADFFMRIDKMDGVNSINGGTIGARSTADIHWLIIPTAGASAGQVEGKLYFVGAELSYIVGGIEESVLVTPDFIRVKPLPEITLDYFLTRDVIADNPLTEDIIEPIVPYTLGVRVQNNGTGVAENIKIESAQPTIVENELNVPIDFVITGSTLNDQPRAPTLLIDFGDIPSLTSSIGRWEMESNLSGTFTEFTASFSHADSLGGALTSLLQATNTHFLVRDVLVDLPGRDSVRDFLVDDFPEDDNGSLMVFESNNVDMPVMVQSADASLSLSSTNGVLENHTLNFPQTDGFAYVKLSDTSNGGKVVKEVVRSDGKSIPLDNAWFSTERDGTEYRSYFNLFDANSTGIYTVVLADEEDVPLPPVLQFIPDRTTHEGKQISFLVEASDPNGTVPLISMTGNPPDAVFNDQGNGRAVFDWTPSAGQAGNYEITYIASDGTLSSRRKAYIKVNPGNDTDGDGMDDAWELENFGTLDRDGTGDFDGDGISDLQEFLDGTDPTTPQFFNFVLSNLSPDQDWQDVSLSGFSRPVVIAGVPTMNDPEPALVRLDNVGPAGFRLRLQEWLYQDDVHAQESVPYLAIEAGRHLMSDGSIWEVGTFELVSEARSQTHNFIQPFPEGSTVPKVYLTLQTTNDSDPVVPRISHVSSTSFTAALYEEETNIDHGLEVVGYIAVYSPQSSSLTTAGSTYLMENSVWSVNSDGTLLSDGVTTLLLQEEASQDDETLHAWESAAVLTLNDAVFAQVITNNETDTVVPRRQLDVATVATPVIAPADGVISEAVTVSLSSSTPGATIHYTLDGSSPDPVNNAAATIIYTTPFTVDTTTTVKAVGKLDGYADSLEATATYTLVTNTPPEFITVPDRSVVEEQSLSFVVQALDQNTLLQPALTVDLSGLPGTPTFNDFGDGSGRLSWISQLGAATNSPYTLTFVATDAQDEALTATASMQIVVTTADSLDSDADGMPNTWETQFSLNPDDAADASLDPDGDGVSNLEEYQQGTNPLVSDSNGNQLPIAIINADVTTGPAPLTVTFDGTASSDSDGTIAGYSWDFGGNSTSIESTLVHEYLNAGTYSVSLTVTDNVGAHHTATMAITVTEPGVNQPPVAVIGSDVTSGSAPITVIFSGDGSSDTDGTITSYSWDFGDTATATEINPTHTYTAAGNYTVTLTVTDDQGTSHTATLAITVTEPGVNQPPTASISASNNATTPLQVDFDGSNSTDADGSLVDYVWDFGDGNGGNGTVISHNYATDGTYTVSLTVTDDQGASNTASLSVTVTSSTSQWAPIANVLTDFGGTPPSGWSYLWNATGDVGSSANYAALQWNGTFYDSDGDSTVNPDTSELRYGKLEGDGGHAGWGVDQGAAADRYVIARYTVASGGEYRLASTSFTRECQWGNGNDLRIYVNDALQGSQVIPPSSLGVNFDTELGVLTAGSTIDVAVGPNGSDGCDGFSWNYDIEQLETGNTLPVVNAIADQSDMVGSNVQLPVTAIDADGDTLTYSASGLPAGVSIDSVTGDLLGTLTTVGSYTVTVTVSDGTGTASTSFTWTVNQVAAWTPIANVLANFGGTPPSGWSYLWNATGDVGSSANYAALQWNGTFYDSDGDSTVNPDTSELRYGKLEGDGGHAGSGVDQGAAVDRYVIARYTVASGGEYRLASTSFTRECQWGNGNDLRLYVNDALQGSQVIPPSSLGVNFDTELGVLTAGSIIDVAVGPNGSDGCDGFSWNYDIERR